MSSSSTACAAFSPEEPPFGFGPHLNSEQTNKRFPVKHRPPLVTHPQEKEATNEDREDAQKQS